jgi:phosphoglycolate phosphatase
MVKRGLVIFDLDGTLFKGADATILAVHKAFAEMGLSQPEEHEVQYLVGRPSSDLHAWLRSQCLPEQAPQLVAAVDRYELASVSEEAELYPGAREALAQVQIFISQMAICTNGPQGYVEHVIDTHDLRQFFHQVRYRRSSDDTKVSMVRELLTQLNGRPAVVVGDRLDDVEAAHQNGLAAVAATYGYGSAEELTKADVAATSPAELPALIRSLI